MTELTAPQRKLLWTVAQHIYGCVFVALGPQMQTAQALERLGLVRVDRTGQPTATATEAGRDYIAREWPVSPFVLGSYDHQPQGWTPLAYSRTQVRQVACPACKAQPGENCIGARGKRRLSNHREREQARLRGRQDG